MQRYKENEPINNNKLTIVRTILDALNRNFSTTLTYEYVPVSLLLEQL